MTQEAGAAPPGADLFDSPEEAALAGWSSAPAAQARVITVEASKDFDGVYVTVGINGPSGFHDRDIAPCVQGPNGKWWSSGSTGA